MTTNQLNQLMKHPNTKKAVAVLQKFMLVEAQYKTAEKEAKAASELIKQAMIDGGVDKITIDTDEVTGYITLAERTNYRAEDIMEVEAKYLKSVLDTDKVKAETVLTGNLPDGVSESKTRYIVKKFKVVE